jgi:hypothetical protein
VPGEYSLAVQAAALPSPLSSPNVTPVEQADLGVSFIFQVNVDHAGDGICTDPDFGLPLDPPPHGCYQGAQWYVDYDETIIDVVGAGPGIATRVSTAPTECNPKNDDGNRVLLGCVEVNTDEVLSYSGPTWNVEVRCIAPGATTFDLKSTADGVIGPSIVLDRHGVEQPVHLHDDVSFTCGPVQCPDSDGDLLDDCEEATLGTDPNLFDTDADGLGDGLEVLTLGTNPLLADTDADGCSDGRELGPDPTLGGERDPLYFWDFFDANGNRFVDLTDTLLVISHFGHQYNGGAYVDGIDNVLDRDSPNPSQLWRTAEANDGISLTDALASLRSFGHGCLGSP